jgi:hypothetical protein
MRGTSQRAGYFCGAVFLHLVVFIIVATRVIGKRYLLLPTMLYFSEGQSKCLLRLQSDLLPLAMRQAPNSSLRPSSCPLSLRLAS